MYHNNSLLYFVCTVLLLVIPALGQALIPNTTVGPSFFITFDGTITINYGNKIDMGSHNYSFVWSANPATLPMYRLTNPQMTLSYYIPWSRDPEFRDVSYWLAFQPTWIVYTCDRVTPARLAGEPYGPVVLDITNPAVINWQINTYAVGKALPLGYTFIAADNFAVGNANSACGVYDANGNWIQQFSGAFTDSAYSSAAINWLKTFRGKLKQLSPPLSLSVNFVIGGQDMYSSDIQGVTQNIDAIVDEAGITQWGGGLNDEPTWLNIINYIEYVQSLGKAYFMINQFAVLDQPSKEYAMASYLLCKNQAASVQITTIQGYGIESYMPEYGNLGIGYPLAPKYKTNGMWFRQYSNGTVVVNGDSISYSTVLQRDYIDGYGKFYPIGSSITLSYHQGIVLAFASATTMAPTRPPPASATTKPMSQTNFIAKGSTWSFFNNSVPATTWSQPSFDSSSWYVAPAPFATGYGTFSGFNGKGSYYGPVDYYLRQQFTIAPNTAVGDITVSVASDNNADVYLNGNLVLTDPITWHSATYWNNVKVIPGSLVSAGINTVAVLSRNNDAWAYFDCQISALTTQIASSATVTSAPTPAPASSASASGASSGSSSSLVIPRGSTWLYYNKSAPTGSWTQQSFDQSQWMTAVAPFATGYSAYPYATPFGMVNYYFRKQFTVSSGSVVSSLTLSVASDNYAIVYINGVLVDQDPATWHAAAYWNRQITINNPSMLVQGANTIAVVTFNMDQWAFFDLELAAQYSSVAVPATTQAPASAGAASGSSSGSSSVLLSRGSSWGFFNKSAPATTWVQTTFDDSQWSSASAPFVNNYPAFSSSIGKYTSGGSYYGPTDYYFRTKFSVPASGVISSVTVSVASDNNDDVYINGVLVGKDTVTWHAASYWNIQYTFAPTMIYSGMNTIAVYGRNNDQWAFFDLEVSVQYSVAPVIVSTSAPVASAPVTSAPVATSAPASSASSGSSSAKPLVSRGSSWMYTSNVWPATGWIEQTFDSSSWSVAKAPFVNNYAVFSSALGSYTGGGSFFGATNYFFRQTFTVSAAVSTITVSVASDNNCDVYINGVLIGKDPVTWHPAAYWNKQYTVAASMLVVGVNTISVVAYNNDQWAFFDLEVMPTSASSGSAASSATSAPAATSAPIVATSAPTAKPAAAATSAPSTCSASSAGSIRCNADGVSYSTCTNLNWVNGMCAQGTKCIQNGNNAYCGWA